MAEQETGWRRPGRDMCRRRHSLTQVECVLADTHYPQAHLALDGSTWHDGLCGECHGAGVSGAGVSGAGVSGEEAGAGVCGTCKGVGFALVDAEDA